MKLGIIGVGIVGGALKRYLEKTTNHEILCVDRDKGYNDDLSSAKALFICLPVPTNQIKEQYKYDLQHAVEQHSKQQPWRPIFVRSTVLPGTCDYLSTLYNAEVIALPEFLTERTSDQDFNQQDIVAGCFGRSAADLLPEIFPGKEIIQLKNFEAELAKYAHNCFGAVKVNYFNMIHEACDRLGARYDEVVRAVTMSGYINAVHTQVPGPDGRFGFGGKCFPKDLSAFVRFLSARGVVGAATLSSVELDNFYYRDKQSL